MKFLNGMCPSLLSLDRPSLLGSPLCSKVLVHRPYLLEIMPHGSAPPLTPPPRKGLLRPSDPVSRADPGLYISQDTLAVQGRLGSLWM